MHFLLLGASGRTGQHVVSEVLSQGHTAVALVRTSGSLIPSSWPHRRHWLATIEIRHTQRSPRGASSITFCSDHHIEHSSQVRQSFRGSDLTPRFLADSCANVCEVLEHGGIYRVVVMSTAGVGDSWNNLPWLSKAFLGWTNVKYALEDHGLVDKEIRLTKMDWTLVRAVRLQSDEQKPIDTKTDVKTLGSKGDGMSLTDSVSVTSVASFLVKVAVEGLFVQSAVVVAN